MEIVPLPVTGLPLTVKMGGTANPTLVTVPDEAGAAQAGAPDTTVRTCPLLPTVTSPVPPLETGRALPLRTRPKVPAEVMGEPITARNGGAVRATLVTLPPAALTQVMGAAPPPPLAKTWPAVPALFGYTQL